MPMLIPHCDEVARRLNQDLLMIHFMPTKKEMKDPLFLLGNSDAIWGENHPMWASITEWLRENGYTYGLCGGVEDPNSLVVYKRLIYLDQKFDVEDPRYKQLESFLQYPDEKTRHKDVRFEVMMLEDAIGHGKKLAALPPVEW